MKKKILLSVFIAHLCLCLFLSFDWGFLQGDYFGFGATFLIVYGLSIPMVISILAIVDSLIKLIKKNHKFIDYVILSIGVLIFMTYLFSASGLLKGTLLTGVAYATLPFGTLAILGCEIGKITYRCKNRIV